MEITHYRYPRIGPLIPYAACFVAVWGLIGLEPRVRWGEAGVAAGLQVLVAAGLWWRARWESGLVTLAEMLLFLASVALLRDGVGHTVGGYGSLVLLPVIWAALRGRRGELAVALAGAAVVQFAPLAVVGAPFYPASGWRSGALLIVVAAVLGTTVLTLVDRLGRSERLHRLLAENSSDLVVRTSRDGAILYASPAAVPVLGYPPSQLVGRSLDELTHPDDLAGREERARGIAQRAIPLGEIKISPGDDDPSAHVGSRLARMRHQDGRWLWLDATIRPIRDPHGLVVERQWALRDVTERVARDADQRALHEISTLVAMGGDPSAVFEAVAEAVVGLLDATTGAVVRFDAGAVQGQIVGVWTADGHQMLDVSVDLNGATATAHVYRDGVTSRVDQLDDGRPGAQAGVRVAIGAPVTVSGRLWGAVVAAFTHDEVAEGVEDRLARFAGLVSLAISNAEAREALSRQASTDALTGLANHRVFHEQVRAELERAHRHDRPLTIALIDIDHFKRVNDTFGHQVGDHVLVEVAQAIAAQARTGEVIARVGGEEFAWLMPDTAADGGWTAAERARQAIAELELGPVGRVAVSVGICCTEEHDAQELIRAADLALYQAKQAGRNRTVVAPSVTLSPP
jgi:diguanylate cyclase (GGDEF)-like protein/PAS domain S-box-containing protein